MKTLRRLKRKFLCLIERIRLSETEYLNMKTKTQMFNNMMATIKFDSKVECETVKDAEEKPILVLSKNKVVTLSVDIKDMLAAGGITFDEDVVIFNVTGF